MQEPALNATAPLSVSNAITETQTNAPSVLLTITLAKEIFAQVALSPAVVAAMAIPLYAIAAQPTVIPTSTYSMALTVFPAT
jgi:hypothetical protein